MFAIGLLSLLSLGFVGMAMGGGDDDVSEADAPEDVVTTDDGQQVTLGPLNIDYYPPEDVEPETQARIEEFIENQRNTPGLRIEDAVRNLNTFLAEIEAEEDDVTYDTASRNALIQGYVPIEEVDEETNSSIAEFLDALDPGQPIIEAADAYKAFVTQLGVELVDNTIPSSEFNQNVEVEQADEEDIAEAETGAAQEYDTTTRDNLILGYVPIGDVDAATGESIMEFLETLDPGLPIIDAAVEFRSFVTELGVEVTGGPTTDVATETEVPGPPIGEMYRDPIIVAEELEAQRILDEIAAEEARQPVNLVTITDSSGAEIPDEQVLTENAAGAASDPGFTVIAPFTPNDIEVGYDAEHTFQVVYTSETGSVTVGVNSTVQGPDGIVSEATTNGTDDNGGSYEQITVSQEFESSTAITLNVADDHIGTHIAQIDLTNPADTLQVNFGEAVDGDMHLVYFDSEDSEQGDSSTTKRAFLIQTSAGGPDISEEEFFDLLATEDGQMTGINIIAEIYLGEDSLALQNADTEGGPYKIVTSNMINDAPQISSSIAFTAVENFDDTAEMPTGDTPGGLAPDVSSGGGAIFDDDPATLFENLGLNPGFFGF